MMITERPSHCPSCGSPRVASILYGEPTFDSDLQHDIDSQRVVLGGCMVSEGMPEWQCVDCHHDWDSWRETDD